MAPIAIETANKMKIVLLSMGHNPDPRYRKNIQTSRQVSNFEGVDAFTPEAPDLATNPAGRWRDALAHTRPCSSARARSRQRAGTPAWIASDCHADAQQMTITAQPTVAAN
jgi:hypothetical protein